MKDSSGQSKFFIDLEGTFVELDRFFDAPGVSVPLLSIYHAGNQYLGSYCPDWKLIATGRNGAVDWSMSR